MLTKNSYGGCSVTWEEKELVLVSGEEVGEFLETSFGRPPGKLVWSPDQLGE